MLRQLSADDALLRLEKLCARSEQCESELADKLRKWGVSASDSERVIDSLRARRFVDNSRYAESFVRDKYRFAMWGRRKIRFALKAKRISDDLIDRALDCIDPDEYLRILRHILRRKASGLDDPDSFENRTKLFRFALARGFESDLTAKILREKNNSGTD